MKRRVEIKFVYSSTKASEEKLQEKILWILLKHCNCNDLYIYLKNTTVIKKFYTSIKYIFICSNVN